MYPINKYSANYIVKKGTERKRGKMSAPEAVEEWS